MSNAGAASLPASAVLLDNAQNLSAPLVGDFIGGGTAFSTDPAFLGRAKALGFTSGPVPYRLTSLDVGLQRFILDNIPGTDPPWNFSIGLWRTDAQGLPQTLVNRLPVSLTLPPSSQPPQYYSLPLGPSGFVVQPSTRYAIGLFDQLPTNDPSQVRGFFWNLINPNTPPSADLGFSYQGASFLNPFISSQWATSTSANSLRLQGEPVDPSQIPGSSVAVPLLPVFQDGNGFTFSFVVDEPNTTVYIDPDTAIGYDYFVSGGPRVAAVTAPSGINASDVFDLFLDSSGGACTSFDTSAGQISGGLAFRFSSPVSCFSIRGIDAAAGLDPTDPEAFVTALLFETTGPVQVRQNPITASAPPAQGVPGPLPALGLAAAFRWSRQLRRRTRQSMTATLPSCKVPGPMA
jgi:hypothetical protein